jgi:Tfp pilus assembly protein PilF
MSLQKQELGEALRLKPDYLPARIELVELLLKTGGAQSALKLLDEVPQEQKQNAAIVLARNWALIDLGRFEEARVEVDRVLAASPIPEVILQDASLKLAKKDYAGARTAVEKVLNADPGNIRALTALMKIYAAQKDAAAAVQKVREYAARQPKSAALQQFLGQLLMETGDKAGARQAFDAARSAGLKTLAPDLQLAQLDIAEGKRDDARKRLAELLAANPRNQQAHWLTAQVDIADGKITTAIDRYRKLLDMDPNNSNVMNNLAYLLADGNQADEALKYAQMAKQLAPEDPAVEDTLGWTYYQKGMYQLAVAHLRSATGRQNSARRQYHLAMAYLKSGDPQHGREALSQALKLDPSLPESQAARQAFGTR